MTPASVSAAQVGDALPEVRFGPITRGMLALYAGASGDHNLIHIDTDVAKQSGMTDVFAQGMLSFGVLARVVTEWAGAARLKSFGARFVSITQVHDIIICQGQIVERFEADGERLARIALEASAQDGRKTMAGEAILRLD